MDLEEGFNVFYGHNGQGKSNLFEGIYILSIAKSSRVSNDKFLINNDLVETGGHAQILGIAEEKNHNIKLLSVTDMIFSIYNLCDDMNKKALERCYYVC